MPRARGAIWAQPRLSAAWTLGSGGKPWPSPPSPPRRNGTVVPARVEAEARAASLAQPVPARLCNAWRCAVPAGARPGLGNARRGAKGSPPPLRAGLTGRRAPTCSTGLEGRRAGPTGAMVRRRHHHRHRHAVSHARGCFAGPGASMAPRQATGQPDIGAGGRVALESYPADWSDVHHRPRRSPRRASAGRSHRGFRGALLLPATATGPALRVCFLRA